MKEKSIYRITDRKTPYTVLSNSILQSNDLTFAEVGLLIYLLSLPEHFTVVQKNILRKCKDRISSGGLKKAWNKLVEKGYIERFVFYRNNLRRVGWRVYEEPCIRKTQNQISREPILLESNQVENKEIENKKIKSNNIGPTILEKISDDNDPLNKKINQIGQRKSPLSAVHDNLSKKIIELEVRNESFIVPEHHQRMRVLYRMFLMDPEILKESIHLSFCEDVIQIVKRIDWKIFYSIVFAPTDDEYFRLMGINKLWDWSYKIGLVRNHYGKRERI